jgi:hypothetical protein
MKVLLINIDGYKNYALDKIELYHKNKGDEVIKDFDLAQYTVDKTYVSCIFSFNAEKVKQYINADIGGTGVDLIKILPQEIDSLRPKVNYGFCSRGCIRKCGFCVVPQKEGKIRVEADLYDIWDGKAKEVELYDNNITALPEHFRLLCEQGIKEKVKIDFNQGMDIRLFTKDMFDFSKKAVKEFRFAFDNISLMPIVEKQIKIIGKICARWYVFTGLNTTWKDTMERLEYLKAHNQRPYLMRHETVKKEKDYIKLARWVNQPHLFMAKTWDEFLKYEKEYCK